MRHEHPQAAYAAALDKLVSQGDRWLDLGCGRQIVPEWGASPAVQSQIASRASLLVGADVDDAIREHPLIHERVSALGDRLPFRDQSFDLVSANMVMEHVPEPVDVFQEVERILRPGGRFVFHTPNSKFWAIAAAAVIPEGIKKKLVKIIEGREAADVFPTHYRANTPGQVMALGTSVGLSVERLDMIGPYPIFARFPALRAIESPLISLLKKESMKQWRSNLLVVLRKPH